MTKPQRQAAILDEIGSSPIRTQEELAEALRRRGVETSQVTLSRDLRELGVVKTPAGYAQPNGSAGPTSDEELSRVLRQFLMEVVPAQNLVVIKTRPGGANTVALAIDNARLPDIVGTVAGDDTILTVAPTNEAAQNIAARLREA